MFDGFGQFSTSTGGFSAPTQISDTPPGIVMPEPLSETFNRIWVVPTLINAANPQIGVPIPFIVWNAYPAPNTLNSIGGTGTAGLLISPAAPVSFLGLEEQTFNVVIDNSAPPSVNANFTFDFTTGQGSLQFIAVIVEFLSDIPDAPVSENWEFLTDIITAFDGTEERRALRITPRTSLDFGVLYEDGEERRTQYDELFKNIASRALVPYYQYSAAIQTPSAIGADRIFFDPRLTSARDGEFVLLRNRLTGETALVQISQLETDGATLKDVLTIAVTLDFDVIPTVESSITEQSGLANSIITGETRFRTVSLGSQTDFVRPNSSPTITTFDGLNVLDRFPLAGDGDELFGSGKDLIDGDGAGITRIDNAFTNAFVQGSRTFQIDRYQDPDEVEYWKSFLAAAQGQRNSFLFPTYLSDLSLASPPMAGVSELEITQQDYASRYFPNDTYQRLRLELADGTAVYRKVLSVNGTTLSLDAAIQVGQTDIVKVSFLNRVRLGGDTVRIQHDVQISRLSITLRTVDI